MLTFIFKPLTKLLINYLEKPSARLSSGPTGQFQNLQSAIQAGDVLLVEGKQRFSTAIKYLTQSNWSHAALYIGDGQLIEADLKLGVISLPLESYKDYHTRVCRPHQLAKKDLAIMIDFIKNQQGLSYDIKAIFDLARYLFPLPFVPFRYKRKVLEFGSGDPTKVICSSVIAQAFQLIRYPVLPIEKEEAGRKTYMPRHHTLITPSDYDRSPYFHIVKPTLQADFNYQKVDWVNR